jgi:hypothetical protein
MAAMSWKLAGKVSVPLAREMMTIPPTWKAP